MALTTVVVNGNIHLPDGAVPESVTLEFRLIGNGIDMAGNDVIPQSFIADAVDASTGAFTANLWPNDRGAHSTYYEAILSFYGNSRQKRFSVNLGSFQVPAASAPHEFATLRANGVYSTESVVVSYLTEEQYDVVANTIVNAEAVEAAVGEAGAARDAAVAAGLADGVFSDTTIAAAITAGLAATASGGTFYATGADVGYIGLFKDVSGVASELARITKSAIAMKSLFSGNDMTAGSTGWNVSGGDSFTWDTSGLTIEKTTAATTFPTLRVYKAVSGGVPVVAGHRYAFFADFDLEADQAVSAVSTLNWRPFLLSSTQGSATVGKELVVGDMGSPVSHRVVTTFTEDTTKTAGNPYTDISDPEDASSQNLLTADVRVTYRTFMLIDLGTEGMFYDMSEDDLARAIVALGAPYSTYPWASPVALSAGKAGVADTALYATESGSAEVADIAEAVRSPFAGRRIMTLGHSLVSQTGWQPYLLDMLGIEGYSVKGISGGTLQPKPSEGIAGMYSRAYMTDMLTSLVNFRDGSTTPQYQGTYGFSAYIKGASAATIFWLGANDAVTDLANVPYQKLYLDGAFISTLASRAAVLSSGHYVSASAGLAGTTVGEYFTVDGDVSGFKVLYEHRNTGSDIAQPIYHYPAAGTDYDTDRIMTTAEQDEFEARNSADGSAAFLSEPLSNGFIVTYEALYHTMIYNYLSVTGYHEVPEHRFFIVREPQAFWAYDGSMDWPHGHYEKNEVHRRVADRWGIPLIDQWSESGINIATRGQFLQNEAGGDLLIHHTSKGGKQSASLVASRMLQFPPLDFTGLYGTDLGLPTASADLGPWGVDNVVSPE